VPTAKSLLGRRAEDLACQELTRLGCELIEKNYRCRFGEIDIIVRDKETVVFVEVRSRRSNEATSPAESVTKSKQSKLVLTAQHYLSSHEALADADCRFDVVQVRFERGKTVIVEVITGAFGET
jgi:putative endonuclease